MKNSEQLIQAVYFGNKSKVMQLLSSPQGIDINYASKTRGTALYTAIFHGQLDLAKILIDCEQVDVNQPNEFGSTVLHLAAAKGYDEILLLLLGKNGNINKANHNGETPLFKALSSKRRGTAKLLLDNGASANAVVKNDTSTELHKVTPLHYAAMEGDIEMIQILIEKGARDDTRTEEGQTARNMFQSKYPQRIAEFDEAVRNGKSSKTSERQEERKESSQAKNRTKRKYTDQETKAEVRVHRKKSKTKSNKHKRSKKQKNSKRSSNKDSNISFLGSHLKLSRSHILDSGAVYSSTTHLQNSDEQQKRSSSKAHVIHASYKSKHSHQAAILYPSHAPMAENGR